nr:glutathione transferase GstA [Deltaproteobacteria bacterium]
LSPHIALREAGLPFELAKVDLKNKRLADGGDWLAINPKGYVPALRLPDGEILTEGAIIVQYIADQRPAANLAPANGTAARYRLNETLHFIATELHKGMAPLFNVLANEDYKSQVREKVGTRFATLATMLRSAPYLQGEQFTIADAYAYYVQRAWQGWLKQELTRWPELVDYYQRLGARPAIAAALAAEGLTP